MLTYSRRVTVGLAVLQPLLLSWLICALFTLCIYVVTSSSPFLGDFQWMDAVRLGGSLWLLALGTPIISTNLTVSLMPIVLTVLIALWTVRFLRTVLIEDWYDVLVAAGTGGALCAFMTVLSLPNSSLLYACISGVAFSALCAQFAWVSTPPIPFRHHFHAAWLFLRPFLAIIFGAGTIVLIVAIIAGFPRILAINSAYHSGLAGSIFFFIVQLFFLPVGIVWGTSWLVGTGFSVGTGTNFSIFGSVSAPIPGIPIFGALPQPQSHPWFLVLVLPLMSFLLALLYLRKARRRDGAGGKHDERNSVHKRGIAMPDSSTSRKNSSAQSVVDSSDSSHGVSSSSTPISDDEKRGIRAFFGIYSDKRYRLPRFGLLKIPNIRRKERLAKVPSPYPLPTWGKELWILLVFVAVEIFVIVSLLSALTSGGFGPVRMQEIGTQPPLLSAGILLVILVPVILTFVINRLWHRRRIKVRAVDDDASVPTSAQPPVPRSRTQKCVELFRRTLFKKKTVRDTEPQDVSAQDIELNEAERNESSGGSREESNGGSREGSSEDSHDESNGGSRDESGNEIVNKVRDNSPKEPGN